MKETKDLRTNKGITLIALVITIIVMLILVGVTISMAVNGGLFDYAGRAVSETNNALKAEGQIAEGGIEVDGVWYNSIDEYLNKDNVETISKETSYVGCYADVNGDGDVDGVIYADLAFSSEENASWYYGYSYTAIPAEELKDYYVSGTYDGDFNEEGTPEEVVTAVEGTTGKDRFYVMALEDFTEEGNEYRWYYSADNNKATEVVTEDGFGTGKANTVTMIEKWNASAFGTQNGEDVWGPIQNSEEYDIVETENDSGKWFVPSIAEWDAFADVFDVDSSNYSDTYGLSAWCWSSSQSKSQIFYSWTVFFTEDYMGDYDSGVCDSNSVRLSATF